MRDPLPIEAPLRVLLIQHYPNSDRREEAIMALLRVLEEPRSPRLRVVGDE